MAHDVDNRDLSGVSGLILHGAARYDLLLWLRTLGRERTFRERLLSLVHLAVDETVLDVGCGTGTLAIAAKRVVGPAGIVVGIDASPEMIVRARRKATKAGVNVVFEQAAAQALPFSNAQFDVVLSTLMLHHLPRAPRQQSSAEIRRVLKPGGRVLAVDFGPADSRRKGLLSRFHRHGHTKIDDIIATLCGAGLTRLDSGSVGIDSLQFVIATTPEDPSSW